MKPRAIWLATLSVAVVSVRRLVLKLNAQETDE